MDSLPFPLLEKILFKLDPKSLAMVQCTNRSIRLHISEDPYFKSEYLSRVGSGSLFHISTFGSNILFWHLSSLYGAFRSTRIKDLVPQELLASCSGLALLFVGGLCVANPLAGKSCRLRSVDHSESKLLPDIISTRESYMMRGRKEFTLAWYRANCIGFAVDPITQRFNVVCIAGQKKAEETVYVFEVSTGDSCWKLSESTVTCCSSLLVLDSKPVYLDGYVHWLRNDGSIVAFNPETEQARLIPVKPPSEKQSWKKIVLAAADKELNLIMAEEEVTCVYALEDILTDDPKWVLVKRIENRERMINWNVAGYDGECLVVKEKEEEGLNGAIHHVYGLRRSGQCFFSSQNMIMKLIGGVSRDAFKVLRKKKWVLAQELNRKEWRTMDLELRNNKRIRLN